MNNENCKDCPYVQNLKDDIKSLKVEIKDLDERVIVVEKFSASGGEQIKMIFKILSEIKSSVKDISTKLGNIEKQPGEEYSKIKIAIISSICTGIIGVILGIIFTKK